MKENHTTTAKRPLVIPLGGFLGAGKTSLILAAARLLEERGIKSAAILNDQGSGLVDTVWAESNGIDTDQVTGGCFCCLFSDLIDAAERLRAHEPDVIFAEAVGSCTDISATTLQPLKLDYADTFRVAPYTVLVDPARARDMYAPVADPDFAFLFHKQLEEADIVCFTKTDLYCELPTLPVANAYRVSSVTKSGVSAWLNEVMGTDLRAGSKILEIDYRHYANAEVRLAWLNCHVLVALDVALSPPLIVGPLLDELEKELTANGFLIAHVKITDSTPAGSLKASLVGNGKEPNVSGNLDQSPSDTHDLLLNVRAAGEPVLLQQIVEQRITDLPGRVEVKTIQCFQPSPPKPQYRMSEVVETSR